MWWFCDARFYSCLVRPTRVIFFLAAFRITESTKHILRGGAVWSARRAHNPKVGGSNPPPATMKLQVGSIKASDLFLCLGVSASLVLWVPRGGQRTRDAYEHHRVFLRRGRISHRCSALRGACRFAIGCPAAGRRSFPVGVAPFDAAEPGYSLHWCFFMSTQPLSRKATPSSASSARWSGKLGARRPAWLTTRWHG